MLDKLCWTFALCTALPCLLLHLRPQHTTLLTPFFFFPSLPCHHSLCIFFSLASSVLIQTVSLCCGSCGRWRTDIHQHKARVPYYVCAFVHVCLCGSSCWLMWAWRTLLLACSWGGGSNILQYHSSMKYAWTHTHIEETLQHCGFSFFTSSNIGKPPRFKLTFPVPPRPSALSTSLKQDVTQGVYPDTTNFKYLYYSWIFPFYVSFFLNFWLAHRLTTDWLLHIAHASCNDDFTST